MAEVPREEEWVSTTIPTQFRRVFTLSGPGRVRGATRTYSRIRCDACGNTYEVEKKGPIPEKRKRQVVSETPNKAVRKQSAPLPPGSPQGQPAKVAYLP